MKKKYIIPGLVLIGCMFFAACGSTKSASYKAKEYAADNGFYAEAESMPASYSKGLADGASFSSRSSSSSSIMEDSASTDIVSRKVIKNASLEVQTRTFDAFIEELNRKINEFDGYIESASVSGNNIYSSSSRNAYYTIRVPEDKLSAMMDSIGDLGTVITSNYNEDDITLSYVDVESRIKTLTTEQETLLGLLEKAGHLEDIIRLEERLSEVNYQLETYKSRQRTYDNKISYSTLNVNVKEVMRVATVVEPEPQTLGQRIANGFGDNMQNIKTTLENFIVWFLSYIVNIILVCGCIAIGVVIVLKNNKKGAQRRKAEQSKKNDSSNETEMGNNK